MRFLGYRVGVPESWGYRNSMGWLISWKILLIKRDDVGIPSSTAHLLNSWTHGLLVLHIYIYCIYLESQKRKVVWSLWEKAVMIVFCNNIVFTRNEKKMVKSKEHCSPTRSKTELFRHFVENRA